MLVGKPNRLQQFREAAPKSTVYQRDLVVDIRVCSRVLDWGCEGGERDEEEKKYC